MKLLIAEARGFSPQALEILQGAFEVRMADLGRHDLLNAVADADILWVRLRNHVDQEMLAAAPQLRCVVTNTTGLNHIDLNAAEQRGIRVLSLRGEVDFLGEIRATAELALGLLLALVRHIPAASRHVCTGGWDRDHFKGHELSGKTAAVVGYGRLGRIMARYLKGLDLTVIAVDPAPEAARKALEDGTALLPLADALARADIVTLHVDLTPKTVGMFDGITLARIKRGAWLVNTARGELLDERALLDALETGRLSGAALDVISGEYMARMANDRLIDYAATHDNLLLTPHLGGNTFESLEKTEIFLAKKLAGLGL